MFNPEIKQAPTSQQIPFFTMPDRKISVQDVEHFLSSHYQGTPYDPFEVRCD
ncbi:MAG: C69 family dipeptidase [Acetilactobacillus jinshanensis]